MRNNEEVKCVGDKQIMGKKRKLATYWYNNRSIYSNVSPPTSIKDCQSLASDCAHFTDSRRVTNSWISNWMFCQEVLIRVSWCLADLESSKVYASHLLDAAKLATILIVAQLSIYCNCYDDCSHLLCISRFSPTFFLPDPTLLY